MAKRKNSSSAGCGFDSAWQARSDMQALQLAHEIMADPKRVKAAKAEAVKQVRTLLPLAASAPKAAKKQGSTKGKRLFGA